MGDSAHDFATLRQRLLQAREARQAALDRLCGPGGTTVCVSAGVPGPDKWRPGVAALQRLAERSFIDALPAPLLDQGRDALGPWAVFRVPGVADIVKLVAVDLERSLPVGRLLDLDVYDGEGRQVDRASLGLPARSCLVCDRPAVECIRERRHPDDALSSAVDRLLARVLARLLVDGARVELSLTPKPGLVDRLDCGSHPDLSFDAMSRSIDLLPRYFDDLLGLPEPLDLPAAVEAGKRAERRMTETIGTNTHKGYIFLAGLVLLAARTARTPAGLRSEAAALARRILVPRPTSSRSHPAVSHGARVRADHSLGGIHREALLGLPTVFDRGLPVLAAGDAASRATQHRLMAVLMQAVEDTTAVHRCGIAGLARLRTDGARLQRLIDDRDDYLPWLAALNDDYRRLNLTMGGVADCMALCFALHGWLEGWSAERAESAAPPRDVRGHACESKH